MKKKILELKNISYSYDGETNVLKDISISIYEGERIAVLGTNGSGKSTFFLCCNGVLYPQSGNIFLYNENIYTEGFLIKNNRKDLVTLRKNVGIVFQDPNQQFIGTTVFDDISFGVLNMGVSKKMAEEKVTYAMDAMNLKKLIDRQPHYLSGGEKKRLSIADIIAMEPRIILFDEPTAFLDTYNTEIFRDNLEKLHKQNKALLVSTHDIDFALGWSDRVIIFNNGEIIADGKTTDILSDNHILQCANLRSPLLHNIFHLLKRENIIKNTYDHPKDINQLELILKKESESH